TLMPFFLSSVLAQTHVGPERLGGPVGPRILIILISTSLGTNPATCDLCQVSDKHRGVYRSQSGLSL
ncbi:MAG: hypothetical protein ACKVH9_02130, partial [Rhodobacterales bacterium]